jgi:nucleoside-diphosphate-sugar epimerase
MQVLIVGGAGEVGRYLAKDLSPKGYEVTVLDRAPKSPEMDETLTITYTQADLTDVASTRRAVQGKEAIFHLAWSFADDPQTVFGEDIQGHINLLEAASSAGTRSFLYTSTATVYGRAAFHPVTETHPCLIGEARKPLYALGKYTAEELCKLYHKERKLPVTIFRFWWAFGESIGGRHLWDLMKKSLKNQPLEMVQGAGGTFVTMADLARAMASAISNPAASGQVYNVGSLFLTWEEIGKMIVRLTGSTSGIQLIPPDRWEGPAFLNEVWDLSWDKAERDLGYKPKDSAERMRSSFMEALRNCVAQVKKEGL